MNVIGIPENKERKAENIFKEIIAEKYLNLGRIQSRHPGRWVNTQVPEFKIFHVMIHHSKTIEKQGQVKEYSRLIGKGGIWLTEVETLVSHQIPHHKS